jgi:apolipoprotein N-acyltransferase
MFFPHEVRSRANPETDFLLNLTNDGWFGQSAAQWQHAQTGIVPGRMKTDYLSSVVPTMD